MHKIFGCFVLFMCLSLDFCNASRQQKDLLIYFDVEEQSKSRFYKHIMQDSVGLPANRRSDPYHVTLLIVADVKEEDCPELTSRFKNVVNKNKLTSSFSFTAHKASLLSNGNVANGNQGTIILESLPHETRGFQALNLQLVDALARYNIEKGASYGIRPETDPSKYSPHLSIAKKEVFDKHSFLNRQRVVQTVNQALSKTRNTDIAKMLSPKPQVKDLWAELKGASRKVPVRPITPLPTPLPAPKPAPLPTPKPAPLPAPKPAPLPAPKPAPLPAP
ncbi:MAG: hypothetical protein K2Y08_02450, partial [Alphaproteobacteria bacterium]|nr:hypothetical protein [Alphaproteobacteria bacterium]